MSTSMTRDKLKVKNITMAFVVIPVAEFYKDISLSIILSWDPARMVVNTEKVRALVLTSMF